MNSKSAGKDSEPKVPEDLRKALAVYLDGKGSVDQSNADRAQRLLVG